MSTSVLNSYEHVVPLCALVAAGASLAISLWSLWRQQKRQSETWAQVSTTGLAPAACSGPHHSHAHKNDPMNAHEYVEILVHNVSHTDMVLALARSEDEALETQHQADIVARPKFNFYHPISKLILNAARRLAESLELIYFPVYGRVSDDEGRSLHMLHDKNYTLPVGIGVARQAIKLSHLERLRFRREDRTKLDDTFSWVSAVHFPLLSVLMPKWKSMIVENKKSESRKIVFLVTGVGTPRNAEYASTDNSTESVAEIMRLYIQKAYPEVDQIVHVHSSTNLFRYDENIWFVKNELLPRIERIRNELANVHHSKWREMLHITISFADGSPARISAINASLRSYTPSYMHFWQLKTFWHESKVCEDDVEIHSFQEIETVPAIPRTQVEKFAKIIVESMMKFKYDFELVVQGGAAHDMKDFWLRKTKKPVLSVLIVQKPGEKQYRVYRGTNMEVSMPTGSLCAERNTIGTALGADVSLRRQDLRMIAVLSLSLPADDSAPKMLKQKSDPGPESKLIPLLQEQASQQRHTDSFVTLTERDETDRSNSTQSGADGNLEPSQSDPLPRIPRTKSGSAISKLPLQSLARSNSADLSDKVRPSSPSLGARVTRLRSFTPRRKTKPVHRTVHTISVGDNDMNPMRPCGACNEWLKKIAEVNPEFTVVTFTDANCTGVYVEQVALM